jgi:hypothetical protein
MGRMGLIAVAALLVAVPASSHAQQRDTIRRDSVVKVDTVKKESKGEKIGRQTGKSLDKAAKTTQHNAKVLGKEAAANSKEGYAQAKTGVKKAARKTSSATKTNLRHLKKHLKSKND